ncbi:TIGR02466 family protein [Sphingomonas sp. VNH70]|uniref:TIGR02466 family protein n=1 Tax=Sphingomonas silueang TaxID=3156617 RepID=UPI0032B47F62
MTLRSLFPTALYETTLGDDALVADLDESVRALAQEDMAGRRWSKEKGYRGYTSYASLNDLPLRDPAFADLKRLLDRHVARFAEACGMELGGRRLKLDSLWVNLLKPGGGHSGHLHPHSVVSGTVYVAVPEGAGGIRFEDPRLGLMMAAPTRPGTFEVVAPAPGTLLLWESWLRHEVLPHAGKGERISVSFNYRW